MTDISIGALTQAMLLAGKYPQTAPTRETGGSFLDAIARGMEVTASGDTTKVTASSLEDRLKARYPGIAYHVFDGSSRYWRYRQDYPFHKIYQQDIDVSEIENWRPSGPNPDPLDAKVQRDLSSIPPGSKAVIIHPDAQKRMETDAAFADEVYKRIEAWFTFDQVRNEAVIPGSTAGMSQCIAIGADGEITNVQACGSSGSISESKSGSDDEGDDFWTARAKRHAQYMKQVVEAQILHKMGISEEFAHLHRIAAGRVGRGSTSHSSGADMARQLAAMQAGDNAIAQTMAMMEGGDLRAALGETVAGVSLDTVFEATRQAIAERPPVSMFF